MSQDNINPVWIKSIIEILTKYYPNDTDPEVITDFVLDLPALYEDGKDSHIQYIMEINNHIPQTEINNINEILIKVVDERKINRQYNYTLKKLTDFLLGNENWKRPSSYSVDDDIIDKHTFTSRLEIVQKEITKQLSTLANNS